MEGDKKLEKLNLRVSEAERETFEKARIKAGYASVSSWARRALLATAETTLRTSTKPPRDIALCLLKGRIAFGTSDLSDEAFEIAIPQETIVEGNILDAETCRKAIRDGFLRLSECFDLSKARVLVTGRILPSSTSYLKELVSESTGVQAVYTIQFSMAAALGIEMDVVNPEPRQIISIEQDWIETAEVCCAGLRKQQSMGTSIAGADQLVSQFNGTIIRDAGTQSLVGARRALPTVRQLFS